MSEDFWNKPNFDELINKRIEEEAFLHYKQNEHNDTLKNWVEAQGEIVDRIRFIAYYLHMSDINKSPSENWTEAQKIYIQNF